MEFVSCTRQQFHIKCSRIQSVTLLSHLQGASTVYPKKYAHGCVVLYFVVVMQSFIMNSHEVFIHIHQDCFAGTGAIVRLPQCQWSKPDGYGKISQCITTTKHSKAKTVCIFLRIYCKLTLSIRAGFLRESQWFKMDDNIPWYMAAFQVLIVLFMPICLLTWYLDCQELQWLLSVKFKSWHEKSNISVLKCGIKISTHSQTSTGKPLKFGSG